MRLRRQAGEANLMIRRGKIVVRNEVNSQEQQINGKEQQRRGQRAPPSSIEATTPQRQPDTVNLPVLRDLANTTERREENTMMTIYADVHRQPAPKAVVEPSEQ